MKVGDKVVITNQNYAEWGVLQGAIGVIVGMGGAPSYIDVEMDFAHKGSSSPIIHVGEKSISPITKMDDDPLVDVLKTISKEMEITNKRLLTIETLLGICEEEK